MNEISTGAWEPDGTGVHPSRTSFDIGFRRADAPAARLIVEVSSCDLDDGAFGVLVAPLFTVYASPAAAAGQAPGEAMAWFDDTDPLPGSYQALSQADQAAGDLAAGIAAGDPAALTTLGAGLASLIFSWDGSPPELSGPGH